MFDKIGKYEIRQELGRGAMGVVYDGFDTVIGRRVAVKTLRTDRFEPRQLPQLLERFKREAQSAGRLAHPHIVTIHDYGEQEGTPYIVMEYIAGCELGRELARGTRYSLDDILRLMTQLLSALTHAHDNGVVHRDVKPSNMFVMKDGSLKVVDFGIARVEESEITDTGAVMGTPAYMSPEQFLGLKADARSDIFSAGVVFYQLLTGDKPFTGSVTTIMQKVLRQEPLPPSELNPTLSAVWDAIVALAMAKKPEARYATARQFTETISLAYKSGRGAQADATVPFELRGRRPDTGEPVQAEAVKEEARGETVDSTPMAAEEAAPERQGAQARTQAASEALRVNAAAVEHGPQPAAAQAEADSGKVRKPPAVGTAMARAEPAKPGRGWRWVMGALLLLLIVLAQVSYQQRSAIVLKFPQISPYAVALCASMGCDLPLPRRIELMRIESSGLEADAVNPDVMALSVTLRNRAAFNQQHPSLELTLTNTQDLPVVRRVLAPRDYLDQAVDTQTGFAASSTIAVKVFIDVSRVKAAGYRLYLFFPEDESSIAIGQMRSQAIQILSPSDVQTRPRTTVVRRPSATDVPHR